ncbi:MAG: HAD-IIA family hydrolase [Actinobacteria bacterium]|nr:HAD-IIA family hydrolase [Actinomycetota bacterium]
MSVAGHAHAHQPTAAQPRLRQRVFAFDMDGVLYLGERRIDGAAEALAQVRQLGLPAYFISNNSRQTPLELALKLQGMGIDAGPEQVVSGVVATAAYLKTLQPHPTTVLVMGGPALARGIAESGFTVASWDGRDAPDVVVVGVDFELSYQRLVRATRAIRPGGARFLAVNADGVYPTADGPLPGSGAIAAAIRAVTEAEPIIVGKPAPMMFQAVCTRAGCAPADLVVVGDLIEADVAGANAFGATSVLVLTGSSTRDQSTGAAPNQRPHYLIETLYDLPLGALLGPQPAEVRA